MLQERDEAPGTTVTEEQMAGTQNAPPIGGIGGALTADFGAEGQGFEP